MPYLGLYSATDRIQLTDEYWVEIKRYLSHDDYAAALRVLVRKRMQKRGTGDTEIVGDFDNEAYQLVLVARAIVDWNLDDEHGNKLPLGKSVEASVARLPQRDFLRLYEAIEARTDNKSEPADDDVEGGEATFPDDAPGVGDDRDGSAAAGGGVSLPVDDVAEVRAPGD